MDNLSLTDLELKNLINLYKSELRKLVFQVNKTSATISELESSMQGTTVSDVDASYQVSLDTLESATTAEKPKKKTTKKKGRGRPKGSKNKKTSETKTTAKTEKKKRGRGRPKGSKNKGKRTRVVEGGYKLSDWDNLIIEDLKKATKPLITDDFIKSGKKQSKKEGSNMSEADVKSKISRSIHKLANKRDIIKKVKKEGRGNAYVLS